MPIEINTTLQAIAAALAADSALSAWSVAAYGRVPKIYINIDVRNPPGEAECPYIVLYPAAARYGRGATEKTIELSMLTAVFDTAFRTYADSDIIEYKGVQNCIDLMDLAVAAIAVVATGNALLQSVEPVFETIENFPFFMGEAPIIYVEPLTLGADRLSL